MSQETDAKPGCETCPEGQADYLGTCLPTVDFATFALSLYISALVHLGENPDPESGAVKVSLPLAKHTIDTLAMLEEKTMGNLSSDEARQLREMLYHLRMSYLRRAG